MLDRGWKGMLASILSHVCWADSWEAWLCLSRLDYRVKEWDVDFRAYLKGLDTKKPVVLCGDLNVAHNEIGNEWLNSRAIACVKLPSCIPFLYKDLANPKGNRKTAGFTVQERESFGTLLAENGFTDSFRFLYPETKEAYSYWSYRSNARVNNKGWLVQMHWVRFAPMSSILIFWD